MFRVADRYTFLEWGKIFFLVLGAMLGLQLLVEVQDSFADHLDHGASFLTIMKLYAVMIPSFLTISLPAAILVSILYALGLLHRNNEFLAFRAAGMSVFKVTRSIWAAGLALSIGLWLLNASLIPWSIERAREIENDIKWADQAKTAERSEVGIVYNLSFDNRKDHRMWFMNRFSQYTETGFGVSLSMMDEQRRELRRVIAREAYLDAVDNAWVMTQGRDFVYDPKSGESVRDVPFEQIRLEGIADDPNLMLLFGKRPKDLSYLELKRITDNFTEEENPKIVDYQARINYLMASAASCLIVTGLAIPFAVSGVRVNPAVGVSKSIALFFCYYILSSVLSAMGKRGIISPEAAAWSPNALMILLTYVLMRRVR